MSILLRSILNRPQFITSSKRLLATATATATTSELKLSDSCVRRLQAILKNPSDKLRVFVEGGGCSGFQYKFTVESNKEPTKAEDLIVEREGVQVVVDKDSLELLKGSTIDYQEELIRSSFRILSNPNAEQGCSCGTSFSIK
jgi:iron-sulfur cluster assembly accessory protein